jgi:hypothetical protein
MTARRQSPHTRRPEAVHRSNDKIATVAERLQFVSRVPMLCECDDESCTEVVMIMLEDFRRVRRESPFLIAPGHGRG